MCSFCLKKSIKTRQLQQVPEIIIWAKTWATVLGHTGCQNVSCILAYFQRFNFLTSAIISVVDFFHQKIKLIREFVFLQIIFLPPCVVM